MTKDPDRMFRLLPGVVQASDAGRGYPLRDLLRVMGEQADVVEADIRRMYDNLFIETCEQWVVPYIGDLVGYRALPIPGADSQDGEGKTRNRLLAPRSAVAVAIALRRRKGTVTALDDLVAAVAGWPSEIREDVVNREVVVRSWRLQSWPLTHVRPSFVQSQTMSNCYALSVLGNDAQIFMGDEPEGGGEARWTSRSIPRPITVDNLDAIYGDGKSLCLYESGTPIPAGRIRARNLSSWEPEVVGDMVAVDPVRGRVMFPERYQVEGLTASYHYGFATDMGGGEYPRSLPGPPVGASLFRTGHLAGRGIPLMERLLNDDGVFATWLRGLVDADVLAGFPGDLKTVERRLTAELNRIIQAHDLSEGPIDMDKLDDDTMRLLNSRPGGPRRITLNRRLLEAEFPDEIAHAWDIRRVCAEDDRWVIMEAVRELRALPHPPIHMVVELADSGLYVEPVVLEVPANHTLELRAADGCRPTIVLPERSADIDDMAISCENGSQVILDGLMVSQHAVRIIGHPADVRIRHCTFVPGWDLDEDCEPCCGAESSLVLTDKPLPRRGKAEEASPGHSASACVQIDRSILGTILVERDEVDAEPVRLFVSDSIVDATTPKGDAIAARNNRHAHAVLDISASTVIGWTRVHSIDVGENSIFLGRVLVARRQVGCMRYSYVPPASRTPPRHACQPDLVIAAVNTDAKRVSEAERVEPRFVDPDLRYGRPDYCRLSSACAVEILRGSDDMSELGVYRHLYEAQRAANLQQALIDYLPLGWDLRPVFVT